MRIKVIFYWGRSLGVALLRIPEESSSEARLGGVTGDCHWIPRLLFSVCTEVSGGVSSNGAGMLCSPFVVSS